MFNLVILFMLGKWSWTQLFNTICIISFEMMHIFTTNQWIIEGVPKFNSSNRNTHTLYRYNNFIDYLVSKPRSS